MMLNCAAIMGRLVADPELKHTQNGIAVTSFTVAVNRSYAKPGEQREADFIDVVAWRGTAEFVCKYFAKGQVIVVQGSIQTRTYTDSNGNKRKAVELLAEQVHFGESKQETSAPSAAGAPGGRVGNSTKNESAQLDFEDFETSDDDLPF